MNSIAPDERKRHRPILHDNFCEKLAFLCSFPKRNFRYKVEREVN